MSKIPHVTFINVQPEEWILAVRTAKWILKHPDQKDIILKFENGITLWGERTPAGHILVKGPTLEKQWRKSI